MESTSRPAPALWARGFIRPMACCAALVAAVSGCSRCNDAPPAAERDGAPEAAVAVVADAARARPKFIRVPAGPRFAVLPGKGISALRLGATVPTIERHMQAKCEELTPNRCRYVTRAVEFELVDGVTQSIYINGPERKAGGLEADGTPRMYGVFNGIILPDLMLGMTPEAIREHLGQAVRVEKARANEHGTEEVHHYGGMILEYDRVARTGMLALGGIKIVK
jgi:hypothetical protein